MASGKEISCREASRLIQPYIRKEIGFRDAEPFIHHIRSCQACYDDLEVQLLVENALEVLDNDGRTDNFDIETQLQEELTAYEHRITARRRHERRMIGLIIAVEAIMVVLAVNAFWPASGDTLHGLFNQLLTGIESLFT